MLGTVCALLLPLLLVVLCGSLAPIKKCNVYSVLLVRSMIAIWFHVVRQYPSWPDGIDHLICLFDLLALCFCLRRMTDQWCLCWLCLFECLSFACYQLPRYNEGCFPRVQPPALRCRCDPAASLREEVIPREQPSCLGFVLWCAVS